MQQLTESVKQYARDLGADLVGIAPVSRYVGAPHRLSPTAHLPEARSVVVMAVHHPDASVEWGGEPNGNFPGPFQIGMIPKLDTIAFRLARFLRNQGHATLPISCTYFWRHRPYKDVPYAHAATFSHMNAFVAAGLGEYGWHGMVMSPQYGPRQRLISVITAAPLTPDPLYRGTPLCDRCGQCERACYGNNYEQRHLLAPGSISFEIEGKRFEYAKINRWRCFWGEQCHLDMNRLAEEENLDEQGIYDAMDRGVSRVSVGYAGYMCASFKHCMAKPVRRWDRAASPGPRRVKGLEPLTTADARRIILEKARIVGADRVAIQPLSRFAHARETIHEGFRSEALFDTFPWVVTLGRSLPDFVVKGSPLAKRNHFGEVWMTQGRLMMGVMDIARRFDDAGYEAMQNFVAEVDLSAKETAGWAKRDSGTLLVGSLLCTAPLKNETLTVSGPLDDVAQDQLLTEAAKRFANTDLLGAAEMKALDFPAGKRLRQWLPEGRTLIVLGVELPQRVVELAGAQEAECGAAYQYAHYQAIREAFWAAHDLASRLAALGHEAVPLVDLDPESRDRYCNYISRLPDMRAQAPFASAAGLGPIGKSGLLMTPRFGPRQRLAFVVTSATLRLAAEVSGASPCPEGCAACAAACPVQALSATKTEMQTVTAQRAYPVFARHEARCEWARCLGMHEGEGAGLLGWKAPDGDAPETLDEETRRKALAAKDPIQIRCYENPNHSETLIERCLQACPLGRH
ncbi:MAG: hypothetical protein GXY74_06945 [Phycisphaerae bacterium]|nr:hypothetical protein [Phycisphaerae bacterium]